MANQTNQKIKKTTIEKAIETLQAVPDKPKEEVSLREAIELMQSTLKQMLDRGYSYDEVAEMLKETGIHISRATLKQYLAVRRTRKLPKSIGSQSSKLDSDGKVAKKSKILDNLEHGEGDNQASKPGSRKDNNFNKTEDAEPVSESEKQIIMKEAQSSKKAEDEFSNY